MWSLSDYWQSAGDYLNLEKASELFDKAREAARDVADTVQAEYQRTFVDLDCAIWGVHPELAVMEFPSDDKIERLAARLNADFPHRYLIYNMSERRYDTSKFSGEVVDVEFRGLPAPPLELLMEQCISAHRWLALDPQNILVVHCFHGLSRSAVFMSCFMAFRGLYEDPVDALHEVCKRLDISIARAISPAQRRYLHYFHQCQEGVSPPRAHLRLHRAVLSIAPRFEQEDNVAFRPYLEIWNQGKLILSSGAVPAAPRPGGALAAAHDGAAPPAEFAAHGPPVTFLLPAGLSVSGDVLLRVRHVYRDGSRETAFRVAFHTGFLVDGLRLPKRGLDTACDDARFPEEFFLDLQLEPDLGAGAADVSAVFDKARDISRRLREGERARREAASSRSGRLAEECDEGAELEKTLRQYPSFRGASAPAGEGGVVPPRQRTRSGGAHATAHGCASDVGACAGSAAAAGADTGAGELRRALAAAVDGSPVPAREPLQLQAPVPGPNLEEFVKHSQDEIDNLFSDFDAALTSLAGKAGPSTENARGNGSNVASTAASKTCSTACDALDTDFSDFDDFLHELDGGLQKQAAR